MARLSRIVIPQVAHHVTQRGNRVMVSGADSADTGLASGLNNTAQQAGAAIGTAVLATLAAATTSHRLGDGTTDLQALRDGYGAAWLAAAAFVLSAIVVSTTLLRPRAATVVGREYDERP